MPAYIRPGLKTPFGSCAALIPAVIRSSGSDRGSKTAVAARTASGARTRVACPPVVRRTSRMVSAPASPSAEVASPDEAAAPIVEPTRRALRRDGGGDGGAFGRRGGDPPHGGIARLRQRDHVADRGPEDGADPVLDDLRLAEAPQELAQLAQAVIEGIRESLQAHQGAGARPVEAARQVSGAGKFERRSEGGTEGRHRRGIVEAGKGQGSPSVPAPAAP